MRCIKEYKSQRMTPEGGFLVKAPEGFEDSGAGCMVGEVNVTFKE